jgi:hypothetical protein
VNARWIAGVTAALVATAAMAAAPSVKQMMKVTVEPASNLLFAVGGEVDPAGEPGPVPAKRWAEAGSAAAKLQLSGHKMAQPAYLKDQGLWLTEAKKMDAISARARAAALKHDGAKLSQAANDLSDVCSACHAKYKPQS